MKRCLVCLKQKDELHNAFICGRCNDRLLVTELLRKRGTRVIIHEPVKEAVKQ